MDSSIFMILKSSISKKERHFHSIRRESTLSFTHQSIGLSQVVEKRDTLLCGILSPDLLLVT
jgi:hypothetical protein